MESIMPLFYRSATIGRSYRKRLHAEIAQILRLMRAEPRHSAKEWGGDLLPQRLLYTVLDTPMYNKFLRT
jgi:hypothetical protein